MALKKRTNNLLTRDEYFKWLRSFPANYCAFCDMKNNILIKDGSFWNLILSRAPYWRYHFLLVPKRHFREFSDINTAELSEFIEIQKLVKDMLTNAKLKHLDGKPINRFLFFWRFREELFDPIKGVTKSDHFHFHIVPEREHLWDAVIEDNATEIDIEKVRDIFRSR